MTTIPTHLQQYFIETEDDDLYTALKQCGYIDSHKQQILKVLWDMQAHPNDEVVRAGGKQYNARILELRRDGWDIVCRRIGQKYCFQLKSNERRW
jgi:hypothetical protein